MNQREAKRAACARVAYLITDAISAGWEEIDQLYGADADKVRGGLDEIVDEFMRRGKIHGSQQVHELQEVLW